MLYYLGPWQWNPARGGFFTSPAGALGAIDLATLPQQAVGGAARSVGLFWTSGQPLDSSYARLGNGDCRELAATSAMQSAFKSLVGYKPQGDKLVNLVMDCLQGGSDPDGNTGPMPIVPTADGWMDLWMPGHSRVLGERFEWGRQGSRGSDHTLKLKQVLRAQFAQLFADAQAGKLKDNQQHRRVLDAWCDKYQLQGPDDWKELVPANLQKEVPGRLKHATTISDNFNQADSTTLGPQLSWTELQGDWKTTSNRAGLDSAGADSQQNRARADSDLSSSDHEASVANYYTGVNINSYHGPALRMPSDGTVSFYSTLTAGVDANIYLTKLVNGTQTNLSSTAVSIADGKIAKVQANGSTIKSFYDGVEKLSLTDTSIAGGVRCGLNEFSASVGVPPMDDFLAADLSAGGGPIYTQLERSTRGVLRGMYTRCG